RNAGRAAVARRQPAAATTGRRSPLASRPSTTSCSPPRTGRRSRAAGTLDQGAGRAASGEEFDFGFQRSVQTTLVLHLGQFDFLTAKDNVVLLGQPGTGMTHVAIALGIRACLAGQRVAFATATEWVARLGDAQRQGRLDEELRKLLWTPLLIVDEVGYIPFDPAAANLMFSLVSSRYERASLIVTSNKPFSAWGEIFGDETVAAAMIDRLVHHAEILSLKGDSYRLRDRDLGGRPPAREPETA
ncbi:MAG: IS21-like element helper ATPase IstB, partial [Gaiellaceae bacterium]